MRAVRGDRRRVNGIDGDLHGKPISAPSHAAAGRKRIRPTGSADVRPYRTPSLRLLPLGAGPRLLGAALIVAALWCAFFWATFTPGGP